MSFFTQNSCMNHKISTWLVWSYITESYTMASHACVTIWESICSYMNSKTWLIAKNSKTVLKILQKARDIPDEFKQYCFKTKELWHFLMFTILVCITNLSFWCGLYKFQIILSLQWVCFHSICFLWGEKNFNHDFTDVSWLWWEANQGTKIFF